MYGYPGEDNGGAQILQPSLADAIRAFATGAIGPEDFHAVFTVSKIFCPRGERPGFLALHYGRRTPLATLFAHLAYGGILGAFYHLAAGPA